MLNFKLLLSVTFCCALSSAASARITTHTLSRQRISEIAAALPAVPRGPGKPITDRAFWATITNAAQSQPIIQTAEKLAVQPIAAYSDDLYLEFSRMGNRKNYENVVNARRGPLDDLILAECLENKGRFLPAIHNRIAAICAERTWVLPAHDKTLSNFNNTTITIDLVSSALAWNLAMADYLLSDKLKADVRTTLRAEVTRRVLAPYRAMIRGERDLDKWLRMTNNWNAVCHAGVIGAALIELQSAEERAEFIAGAEYYSSYFLSGFTPDGYCSEGLGYWGYGFGYFALLSEAVRDATAGKMDFLRDMPLSHQPARFGSRIQIINGISPAFADCAVNARPSGPLMWLLNHRLGLPAGNLAQVPQLRGFLPQAMLFTLAAREPVTTARPAATAADDPLRTWFSDAGVLICRPAAGSTSPFGVAMKGGHNGEHHNHNDLGSFVVVSGSKAVLLDPGGEIYTARTFSAQRYDSKLLNSFGHPVPVVAGELQRSGEKFRAKVLDVELTNKADRLRLDIESPYKVPKLQKLEREFTYNRTGAGELVVKDEVRFASPQTFSTALLTAGTYKQYDDRTLLVTDGSDTVRVSIDAGGEPFKIGGEVINENAAVRPTRIAISLLQPVTSATLVMRITPVRATTSPRK